MAIENINVGATANDGTGDPLRSAFIKCNDNFTDLDTTKQDTLLSGTNIKTLEGQTLLGSGNIDLTKSDVGLGNVDNTSDLNKPISTATQTALNTKQTTLVSGTNIKTINSTSILGAGNIDVVPYSGAISDVDLGINNLFSNKVYLFDQINNNYGSVYYTDDKFYIEDGLNNKLIVIEDQFIQLHKTDLISSNLFLSNLTATREHYLPDASGTIALEENLTNLVPYTGAISDVDLGEFGLKTGNIELDTTPTTAPTTAGSIIWNDSDGTADLILKGGNVTLQIGQESVIRVVNKTATNVNLLQANYQAVRVTGAQGQRLKIDLAQATTDPLSAETIGLVTETINNNQEGFVTTSGLVRNINTTGSLQGETWADGDILYLSPTTAGRVTKVKPVAPNHLIIIGYVISAHATQGSIFVKVDNGYELDELHNVKIASAINGQALTYTSATDIWENKTIIEDAIVDAVTTKAPSQNAVFDALSLKQNTLTNPITGTGTTNYISKFTGTSALGNSQIFDNGTNVGIGTATPGVKFVNSGGPLTSGPTLGSGTVGSQALLSGTGLYGLYSGVSANGDVWQQVQRNDGVTSVYNLALQPSGGSIFLGTSAFVYLVPSKFDILYNGEIQYGMNFKTTFSAGIALSFVNSAGVQVGRVIHDDTGTAYVTTSDYRLKEDLKEIKGLDLISQINVYDYKWKSNDKRSFGVMAHELQEIIPQAVFGQKDDEENMQGVDYSILVPVLIQAIQELKEEVETLKLR